MIPKICYHQIYGYKLMAVTEKQILEQVERIRQLRSQGFCELLFILLIIYYQPLPHIHKLFYLKHCSVHRLFFPLYTVA